MNIYLLVKICVCDWTPYTLLKTQYFKHESSTKPMKPGLQCNAFPSAILLMNNKYKGMFKMISAVIIIQIYNSPTLSYPSL